MDWYQINYFKAVAETQHMTRAAQLLSVSQPALSRSISKLEEELGVQLFDRRGRNVYLNRFGEMFLKHVNQSIQQIEIGKREIWDEIHPDYGTISLSFLPSLGISVIPEILSAYQKEHSKVKFQLNQASNWQIVDQLKSRQIDLAILTQFHEDKEIGWYPLLTEELFVIVSNDHWLSAYDEIDLKLIENEPFITFKDVSEIQTIINNLCQKAGFTPNVVFEGEEIVTVYGLVGSKLGVSLVPDLQVLDKSKIKLIRVKDPICNRKIGLAWIKESYMSPVVKDFMHFVNDLLNGKESDQ